MQMAYQGSSTGTTIPCSIGNRGLQQASIRWKNFKVYMSIPKSVKKNKIPVPQMYSFVSLDTILKGTCLHHRGAFSNGQAPALQQTYISIS